MNHGTCDFSPPPYSAADQRFADMSETQSAAKISVYLQTFCGTKSLPFHIGEHKRVAIKVIDPRGNEVMRVHSLA
jgi:hypothetical protein